MQIKLYFFSLKVMSISEFLTVVYFSRNDNTTAKEVTFLIVFLNHRAAANLLTVQPHSVFFAVAVFSYLNEPIWW